MYGIKEKRKNMEESSTQSISRIKLHILEIHPFGNGNKHVWVNQNIKDLKIRGISSSSTITTNVTYTDTESQTWTHTLERESNGFQDLRSWLSPKLLTCNHPSFHIRVPRCRFSKVYRKQK